MEPHSIPKKWFRWKPSEGKRRPGRPKLSNDEDPNKLEWSCIEAETQTKDWTSWRKRVLVFSGMKSQIEKRHW